MLPIKVETSVLDFSIVYIFTLQVSSRYAGERLCSAELESTRGSLRLESLFALAANNMAPSPIKTPMTIPYVNGASAV